MRTADEKYLMTIERVITRSIAAIFTQERADFAQYVENL